MDSVQRVRTMHDRAVSLMYSFPDSAARLAQELLDFAGSGSPLEQADAYFIKGQYLIFQGRFPDVHTMSDHIARIGYVYDQPVLARAHLLHGIAFRHQGMVAKSLEELALAINQSVVSEDNATLAAALNETGEVMLQQQQQPSLALKYFELATDEARGCNATRVHAQALHNTGNVHVRMGGRWDLH